MTRHGSGRARFGPFEVDLHTHELWEFGTRVELVGQPFEILAVLLSRPGELVTREELRTQLWPGDTFVDFNHGLNAAVNKLREALSDSADAPRYVETLPRRGYRFIAIVDWLNPSTNMVASSTASSPIPIREDLPVVPPPNPALEAKREAFPDRRWPRFFMGAAVLLALLLTATFLLKTVSGYGGRLTTRSSPQRTRALNIVGAAEPAFSPDGNSLTFVRGSDRPGDRGIFVTRVGSNQVMQLTHNDGDCCPVWSPDERSIAFSRFANREFTIYVISADGGAEQKRAAERAPNPTSATFTVPDENTTERRLDTN